MIINQTIKTFFSRATMMLLLALLTTATAWADDVTLQTDGDIAEGTAGHYYVNMPTTGTSTLTLSDASVTTFKVYDDGGKGGESYSGADGNYSHNCDGYLIITVPEGYGIKLTGTVRSEENDYLSLYNGSYNGSGVAPANLGSKSKYGDDDDANDGENIQTLLSSGRSITLYFTSNGSKNRSGIDLTVTLFDATITNPVNVTDVTGGEVSATPTSATAGTLISLTATPAENYMLCDISVTDEDSNPIKVSGGKWYSNTATFTMPLSAATVSSVFTNNLTAEGGLFINMPTTGTLNVDVPSRVKSFKVYDDGGKNGGYSNNCDGYLLLKAPVGYIFQLTGEVYSQWESGIKDYLQLYDGETTAASIINNKKYGDNFGDDLGTILSTGNSILLNFYSDNETTDDGLNITVSVVNTHDLSQATITGVNPTYDSYGALPVPTVTDFSGSAVAADQYDVVCTCDGATVTSIDRAGAYTLTVKAKEGGNYVGSKSVEFFVCILTNGDGTTANPYQLSSVNDIRSLALLVNENLTMNAHAKLMADIDFSNEAKDNVTGNNYLPIGTSEHPYTWHFDGNNHLISGISNENKHATINPEDAYQGVFGYVGTGGTVEGLSVGSSAIIGKNYAGGIAGYNKGAISNCHVLPSVTITGEKNYSLYHGGIAGLNTGTVSGCTSAASVVAGENWNCYYYGGIVGKNSDGTTHGTLSDNLYYGSRISATTGSSSGGDHYKYHGAILGEEEGTLSNNYYTSDIASINGRPAKGCGTLAVESVYDTPYDIAANDGAMPIYKVTPLVSGLTVTTPDGGSVSYTLYDGTKLTYYKRGTTLTVSNSSGKLYDMEMLAEDITIDETGVKHPWGENIGGYCGYTYTSGVTADLHNLYYQITDEDGDNVKETLTIYVTPGLAEGANRRMAYYSISRGLTSPWYNDYASQIKHLIISEGITSTGHNLLGDSDFPNNVLISVTLPSTIGTDAANLDYFEGCNSLEKIIAPVSVFARYAKELLLKDRYNLITPEIDVTNGSYHLEGNFVTENGQDVFKASMIVKANSGYVIKSKTVKIGSTEVAFDMTPNEDGSIYTGTFNIADTEDLMTVDLTLAKLLTDPGITISEIADQTYTGSEVKPAITVKDGTTDITDQCDITYTNNTNVGTATVTIKAKDASANYTGEITTTFKITPKTVSKPTITLSDTSFEYTGSEIKPTVTVKDGETTIPEKEYTVGYSNNTDPGTATVTITDNEGGNYTVSGSESFKITLTGDINGDKVVNVADIVKAISDGKSQEEIEKIEKIIMKK